MLCAPLTMMPFISKSEMNSPVVLTSFAAKDGSQTAHEGGLAAARVGGNTDDDWGLTSFESHVETGGHALSRRGDAKAREGRRRCKGGDGRDGGEGKGNLHGGGYCLAQLQAVLAKKSDGQNDTTSGAVTIVMIRSTDDEKQNS